MADLPVVVHTRAAEIAALEQFVRADPAEWATLAPAVVAAVGGERLEAIVAATATRIGGSPSVVDGPDGLRIVGSSGSVLAWAHLDPAGALDGLLISRAPGAPRWRLRRPAWSAMLGVPLAACYSAGLCWSAGSRWGWAASFASAVVIWAVWVGIVGLGQVPRVARAGAALAGIAALASCVRVRGLPPGGGSSRAWLLLWTACLAIASSVAVTGRRHRWDAPLSRPLSFPLEGEWYVAQGGGRWLNSHYAHADQRAALDLVRAGRWGTRSRFRGLRDLDAYAAYARPVRAPCAGVVTVARDHLEDQVPGARARYGPAGGNIVAIDTGHELVSLCHLRPGSIVVRVGDRVVPGQVVGAVGNSGNSTEPHLHLQAERDGLGLDLAFSDVRGPLVRGRTLRPS